ncbi:acyloxyacyl hydrolase [Shewanella corallii]|uniref:Lipid A deacylase n=1 Tax=Shewanella corallii TaxID=560080 RepID=A0ABT0NBN3_9GAMM|nr:acyloxyacyl hydrolase [Shewanella corallii]MCL2915878.1 acyloxyacyl hydrolase [Shewanella corallii]
MKPVKVIVLMLILILSFPLKAAGLGVSLDYIQGEGDVQGVKLAAQYHTDWLSRLSEHLHLYFETSANFWEFGANNRYDSNLVLSLSPVIQYPLFTLGEQEVLAELGIGIALLDDTTFAGKDVSTHYQFEDRLGLLTRFGSRDEHSVTLRYFHYSNAGLDSPNPGLDFVALSYAYRFR